MPSLRVSCPSCKASLKAGEKYLGRKVRCKKCGVPFRIAEDLQTTRSEESDSKQVPGLAGEEPEAAIADDETPIPGALSLDDDEPAPLATAEPFAFTAEPAPQPPPPPGRRSGATSVPPRPAPPAAAPTAYRPRRTFDITNVIVFAVVFAIIFGGIVGGILVFLNWEKIESATRGEGVSEHPAPAAAPGAKEGPPGETAGTTPALPDGKASAVVPAVQRPGKPAMLALPAGQEIAFRPMGKKPELVQKPEKTLAVEAAFPSVRRAFPPLRRDVDPAVLWQSAPGFQGIGEKLALDLFSPQTGSRVNRLDVDGDGSLSPLCDLSVSADLFALAHRTKGTVSAWNTRNGKKLLDGFDPYADKPEQKKAGLAAIYLTEPPDRLVTVSTSGAVQTWDLASKKLLGEFVPPTAEPGSIAAGKNLCPGPGRQSVVLVAGGSLYKIDVRPKISGQAVADLGGAAGNSFGLAASGDGRVVFVFEARTDGKPEKAVMTFRPEGNHIFYRWPDSAGEPIAAGWCGDELAVVATNRGSELWFEAEGKEFRPLALVNTPADKAIHVAADSHWSLLPDPANPRVSVFVEYTEPQRGLIDPLEQGSKRPALTLRLDEKGLFK